MGYKCTEHWPDSSVNVFGRVERSTLRKSRACSASKWRREAKLECGLSTSKMGMDQWSLVMEARVTSRSRWVTKTCSSWWWVNWTRNRYMLKCSVQWYWYNAPYWMKLVSHVRDCHALLFDLSTCHSGYCALSKYLVEAQLLILFFVYY